MAKIVVLDGFVANPGDVSWEPITSLGHVRIYDRTSDAELTSRAKEANVLIVNKQILTESHFKELPKLKCICTLATGYNNIDIAAARKYNITVCNAVGYGTDSVAQHVFALILELTNNVGNYNQSVQKSEWSHAPDWTYTIKPLIELSGKYLGIYGYGKIGRAVGQLGLAFGLKLLAISRDPDKDTYEEVTYVSKDQFFRLSDIITLHVPLSTETHHFVNAQALSKMQNSAILINTGRGDLVDEIALKNALLQGQIAGAGLDVLSLEPPPENHPLLGIDQCIITPHIAWATKESRSRLIQIVAFNVDSFLKDDPKNVVC